MARKVEWTDPAWEDLADIVDYIARDSEYYAAAFVQEVRTPAGLDVPTIPTPAGLQKADGEYSAV